MRLRFTGFFKENFGSRYYTEVSVENIHSQNKKIHPGTTFFLCLVAVFRKKKEYAAQSIVWYWYTYPAAGRPRPSSCGWDDDDGLDGHCPGKSKEDVGHTAAVSPTTYYIDA